MIVHPLSFQNARLPLGDSVGSCLGLFCLVEVKMVRPLPSGSQGLKRCLQGRRGFKASLEFLAGLFFLTDALNLQALLLNPDGRSNERVNVVQLCFDLFVGRWTWQRLMATNQPLYVSFPVLILSMMVAPLGVLVGMLITRELSDDETETAPAGA